MSGIYAKYHKQIMPLFVYTTTHKRYVIFTCRYFKLSWNTTAISQSNCRNFSCSSIILGNYMNTQTSLSMMKFLDSSNLKSGTISFCQGCLLNIYIYIYIVLLRGNFIDTDRMLSVWPFCTVIVDFFYLNAHLIRGKISRKKNTTIVVYLLKRIIKNSPWIQSTLS